MTDTNKKPLCDECEYILWHGEVSPTGKHTCGGEKSEDDFVEELKNLERTTERGMWWVRLDRLVDLLQRHEAHVMEKAWKETKDFLNKEIKKSDLSGLNKAIVFSIISRWTSSHS